MMLLEYETQLLIVVGFSHLFFLLFFVLTCDCLHLLRLVFIMLKEKIITNRLFSATSMQLN